MLRSIALEFDFEIEVLMRMNITSTTLRCSIKWRQVSFRVVHENVRLDMVSSKQRRPLGKLGKSQRILQ